MNFFKILESKIARMQNKFSLLQLIHKSFMKNKAKIIMRKQIFLFFNFYKLQKIFIKRNKHLKMTKTDFNKTLGHNF